MSSQSNSSQRSQYFQLHFGVAIDVLLIACGLILLSLLIYILPVTFSGLHYTGIITSTWNVVSLVAVAAMLWTVIFLPPNKFNRCWIKASLMLLLGCQAIFILLPDREALATIVTFFGPAWIAIAIFIGLLHLESRVFKNNGLGFADSLRKHPIKKRLSKGLIKLFVTAAFIFFLAFLCSAESFCLIKLNAR